jgi:hypothetical protein
MITQKIEFLNLITCFMFDLSVFLQTIGLSVLTKYTFVSFIIKFQISVFRT